MKKTLKKTLKKTMKKLITLILLATVVACKNDPISTSTTPGNNIQVEYLFEKDGCKMYRFYDGDGRWVYWCNCEGKIEYQWRSQSGKSQVTHQEETIINK